jgi:hypothetical protein
VNGVFTKPGILPDLEAPGWLKTEVLSALAMQRFSWYAVQNHELEEG